MPNEINYLGKKIYITDKSVQYNGSFYNGRPEGVEMLEKFISMLPINSSVLDVGACTGSYALIDLLRPDVNIFSFEPSRAYFELLKNIEINNSGTKAFNIAVSDYDGDGNFNEVIADGSVALSCLGGRPQEMKVTNPVNVNVTSIDVFCEKNKITPDAIKIDVEGSELYVLHGAIEILTNYRPIVFCEYSQENCNQYGYNRGDVFEFLSDLGYNIEIFNNVDLTAV